MGYLAVTVCFLSRFPGFQETKMKGMPAKVKPYFGYNPKVDDE